MFGNKDKKQMSPNEKKAKLKALGAANGMASDMLKDHLAGLKKVTVASDSKTGLKEGLKKAEEIVEKDDESSPFGKSSDEDSSEHEDSESESEEEYEDASDSILSQCDTEDEINDLIAKLEEKKKSLQS